MNRGSGALENGRSRRPRCSRYITRASRQERPAPADDRADVRRRGGCARLTPLTEARGACAELAGSKWSRELTDAGHDGRDGLIVGHEPHVHFGRPCGQDADRRLDLEPAPSITDLSPNLAALHPHDAGHALLLLPPRKDLHDGISVQRQVRALVDLDECLALALHLQGIALEDADGPASAQTDLHAVGPHHDEHADGVPGRPRRDRLRESRRREHEEREGDQPGAARRSRHFDTTTRIGLRPTGTVAMTRLVPVSITRRSFERSCTTNIRVPWGLAAMPFGASPTSISSSSRKRLASASRTRTLLNPATVT